MDWTDRAIVLAVRKHGESSVIVSALTREHGRHGGLVRGGTSKAQRGVLQVGNRVGVSWRARLSDQLGTFTCELMASHAAAVLDDGDKLAALTAACALSESVLPEREPHPALYDGLDALLAGLADSETLAPYVAWEVGLLGELGFGLDFSQCAATGVTEGLAYVSPKSGRAVSAQAGKPYQDKLLPLPGFLIGSGQAGAADVADGLKLTGAFLKRHVFTDGQMPSARQRLAQRIMNQVSP